MTISQLNRLKESRADAAARVRRAMVESGTYDRNIFDNWKYIPGFSDTGVDRAMIAWGRLDRKIKRKENARHSAFEAVLIALSVVAVAVIYLDVTLWRP